MADLTRDTDRALAEARRVRDDNRAGGRHRRAAQGSIGRGSAELRRNNLKTRFKLIGGSMLAIISVAIMVGLVSPIGFSGLIVAAMVMIATTLLFANFPKVKVPQRADLSRATDAKQLVGRTELWLEAQRPALPAPAADMVGKIGVQLDALGLQLDGIDPKHPAAHEVRTLVGETLPEMVDSYRRIPAHLRAEERAGATPDAQLATGLGKISDEIDRVTRQLAEGSIDDLAVKTRYLDYKYGGDPALEASADAPALAAPQVTRSKDPA